MNFVENDTYLDREGKEYKFLRRSGSVLIFEDIQNAKNIVLNSVGKYRWDNQDHSKDIVSRKEK
jgi:hypothetical protein